jgi:hypothetical protein
MMKKKLFTTIELIAFLLIPVICFSAAAHYGAFDAITSSGGSTLTIDAAQSLSAMKDKVVAAGNCVNSYSVNAANGALIQLTLAGNCAITTAAPVAGQSFAIELSQTNTAAPVFNGTYFKWGNQPTWSAAGGLYDYAACTYFNTTAWWCAGQANIH